MCAETLQGESYYIRNFSNYHHHQKALKGPPASGKVLQIEQSKLNDMLHFV